MAMELQLNVRTIAIITLFVCSIGMFMMHTKPVGRGICNYFRYNWGSIKERWHRRWKAIISLGLTGVGFVAVHLVECEMILHRQCIGTVGVVFGLMAIGLMLPALLLE